MFAHYDRYVITMSRDLLLYLPASTTVTLPPVTSAGCTKITPAASNQTLFLTLSPATHIARLCHLPPRSLKTKVSQRCIQAGIPGSRLPRLDGLSGPPS